MQQTRQLGILIVVLALAACSQTVPNSEHYVLLPSNQLKNISGLCSRVGPQGIDGSWKPSAEDIRKLELLLPRISKLHAMHGGQRDQIKDATKYYRQYVAFVSNGRKLVYVNAFCVEQANWRKQFADICDGGNCFWGAIYDPVTGEFSDLQTNGVA